MNEEKRKNELQQKYLEFQLLTQQITEVQNHLNILRTQEKELYDLSLNLSEISKIKDKIDSYSQIGAGVYLKTKLEDTKKILVNVGSDIVVEKKVEDVEKIIKEQLKQLNETINEIEIKLTFAIEKTRNLQEEILEMQK